MLDALLPIDEVRRIVGGKSRRTIYRWIGEGLFPKPIETGPNSVAWPESTIRQFIESKKTTGWKHKPEADDEYRQR